MHLRFQVKFVSWISSWRNSIHRVCQTRGDTILYCYSYWTDKLSDPLMNNSTQLNNCRILKKNHHIPDLDHCLAEKKNFVPSICHQQAIWSASSGRNRKFATPPPGKSDLLPPSKSGTSMCHHRANSELQCATTGQGRSVKNSRPSQRERGWRFFDAKNPCPNQNACESQLSRDFCMYFHANSVFWHVGALISLKPAPMARLFAKKPRQSFLPLKDDQSSEICVLGVTAVHLILRKLL